MKISVIIPVYNVEKYVAQAIESAQRQTYHDVEIILVDDGSGDRSGLICDAYAAKDRRIQVIHQSNAGLSAARNVGVERAQGEYLFFLDADDYMAEDCLEHMASCAQRYQADIVYAQHIKFQDATMPCKDMATTGKCVVMTKEQMLKQLMLVGPWAQENVVIACNKLYARRLFAQIRFPIGRTHEDEYVAHLLYDKASGIVFLDRLTYFYRVRAGSIMTDTTFHIERFPDSFDFGKDRMDFCRDDMPQLYATSIRAYIDNMQVQYLLLDSASQHIRAGLGIWRRIISLLPQVWITQSHKYFVKTCFFLISPKHWRKRYWGK